TGAAAARCYQHGVWYANGEFIQVHPTAIPGADKCRLMSESARGEGGRVWVPRRQGDSRHPNDIPAAERWYFLEEKYPKYGNLVPRDIATREIFKVCMDGMGVGGGNQVYLDLTHLPAATLHKLDGILEIYSKFVGDDPHKVPMKIFPAVHYSMGGLWTRHVPKPDHRGLEPGNPGQMMTNVGGLYAFGEVNFAYHGANRLGANALLSCIFDGLFCGQSVANFVRDNAPTGATPQALLDAAVAAESARQARLVQGPEGGGSDPNDNAYLIAKEMGEEMTAASTVVKTAARLQQALTKIAALKGRYARLRLDDSAMWTNQSLAFARATGDMLLLAESILLTGLARKESRGSHYREDFPDRNDAEFLRTSVSRFDPASGTHHLSYQEVDTVLVKPRVRNYGKVESTAKPAAPARQPALT
ncbi:MAG: FAD-binding protein, partial [Phycisphaerae bacterium]|nr:FAD-binding protein [Phycisphaerae bacterium]